MLPKKTERMLIRHPQPNRAQYVEQDLKKVKVQSKDYHSRPKSPISEILKKDAVITYV